MVCFAKIATFALVLSTLFYALLFFQYSTYWYYCFSIKTSNEAPIDIGELMKSFRFQSRFDASRRYAILDFAIVGSRIDSDGPHDVCLATHASVEYLPNLIHVGQHWQGLMSVAIFVPQFNFETAVLFTEYLWKCFPNLFNNVSLHFVFPVEFPPDVSEDFYNKTFRTWTCDSWPESPKASGAAIVYPQNLLRNVARKNCPTQHVFLTDSDMIPNQGLAGKMAGFLATSGLCKKCAYVVPAYEIHEKAPVPRNKSQLMDLKRKGLARPYRLVAFALNQRATNHQAWEALPDGDTVEIAYRLPCFEFMYEPFYVAEDSVPPHDERFVGYGFTRNTQVYETQLAGFTFYVLNNAFLVHPKMATHDPFSNSKGRRDQVIKNSMIFNYKLKLEFRVKYSTTKMICNSTNPRMHTKK